MAVTAVAVVAVVASVWFVAATRRDRSDAGAGESVGFKPSLETGLGIGDVARLPDGAVARVNDIVAEVSSAPGQPAPEPGMGLVRLDVEVCAGGLGLFVDSGLWAGVGEDQDVYSAHLGVRDFLTMRMAPGSCQRGSLDLAVRDGVRLEQVLLTDTGHDTVARWSVQGEAGEPEPLASDVPASADPIGVRTDLTTGGSVTLTAVNLDRARRSQGRIPVTLVGRVCAGRQTTATHARYWFVQLADNRLIAAERRGGSTQPQQVRRERCVDTRSQFSLPAAPGVVAVIYASDGVFEEGRWQLDS